jgi:hypothetical protein
MLETYLCGKGAPQNDHKRLAVERAVKDLSEAYMDLDPTMQIQTASNLAIQDLYARVIGTSTRN